MEPWSELFLIFVLVLFRIAGFVIFAPFLGSRNIPGAMKGLLTVALALLLFPAVVHGRALAAPTDLGGFVACAVSETAVGILFGFVSSLVFVGIQLGGHLIGQKMGFAMANVVDPFTEAEVTLVEEFKFFLAVFVFLAVGGHHLLMRSLAGTFAVIPLGGAAFRPSLGMVLAEQCGSIFLIALQAAAPALGAMFLVTLAMGFLARAVPQVNIMMISFPIQIAVGLIVLVIFMPVLMDIVVRAPGGIGWNLEILTRLMTP